MLIHWTRFGHRTVEKSAPAVLRIKSNADGRAGRKADDGRAVTVGQVDHAVEPPPSKHLHELELCSPIALLETQHFVDIRIVREHPFRPSIDQHRELRVGIGLS
jgi:hypothetical protein